MNQLEIFFILAQALSKLRAIFELDFILRSLQKTLNFSRIRLLVCPHSLLYTNSTLMFSIMQNITLKAIMELALESNLSGNVSLTNSQSAEAKFFKNINIGNV